ncbi:MAG: NADH ubiquinone oxidoreductase chain A, partial [uncultured Frankineae bacterium]
AEQLRAAPGHVHPGLRIRGRVGRVGRADRAQALQPRQARLVRVRHRAHAAADGRWPLPGEVLLDRHALHRLRHRDDLPDPLGRLLRRPRAVRSRRDGPVHRHRVRRLRLRLASRRARVGL